MSDLYRLTDEQMARLRPYFPKSHGRPRVDDRRVLSSIVFVNRNGLRWRDAPKDYGPHRTLYNRWKRWGEMGVFVRMMRGWLPREPMRSIKPAGKKGDPGRLIGRTKGGMNTKLHAVTHANGRPPSFFMTAGAPLYRQLLIRWGRHDGTLIFQLAQEMPHKK